MSRLTGHFLSVHKNPRFVRSEDSSNCFAMQRCMSAALRRQSQWQIYPWCNRAEMALPRGHYWTQP